MEKEGVSLKSFRAFHIQCISCFMENKIYLIWNIFSKEFRGKNFREYYGEKNYTFGKSSVFPYRS